jgi:ketosteroid isomerase-like protein
VPSSLRDTSPAVARGIAGLDLLWIADRRTLSMTNGKEHEPALEPEDLARFFTERANAGDVDGLAALYEPDAVLAFPPGRITIGRQAIHRVYEELLASRPTFAAGEQRPALRNGNLALTSSRLVSGNVTVEVARRQSDGTWLWLLDQPNILG